MIDCIKNISGNTLDWGNGLTQLDGEDIVIEAWKEEHYSKLCEFCSMDKVEVHDFDGLIVDGFKAIEWFLKKKEKIEKDGHYPVIYDLVDPFFDGMPFHAIDYKVNLLSGVKLHAEHIFNKSGLLERTNYYHRYKDKDNKGVKIIEVNADWVVDQVEDIPVAADIIERSKERIWLNTDDSTNSKKKRTKKKYDTLEKVQDEGKKRRNNKKKSTVNELGMALVLTEEANNAVDAQDIMIQFHEDYTAEFAAYEESGKGNIYDKLDADLDHSWMNTIIEDNPTNNFMLGAEAIGETLKNFTKKKLKGLL